MLWHYPKDASLKPLPKIQNKILIFPSNSNFIEVDSQFSSGIPLGAEEGLELGLLTPPGHTQSFGSAGGRSQIKNLPSGMILWGIRRNMRHGMKSQNCFFFTHWMLHIYFSQFPDQGFVRIIIPSAHEQLSFLSDQIQAMLPSSELWNQGFVLHLWENSSPLMFFWMLIPMTPLSSRSIFPLLVINSLDSHK